MMTAEKHSGGPGQTISEEPPPFPDTADAKAAHEFLCEFRTRIATQPLPYQHGVEARALESLWEVFGHARAAMKSNPGCANFARITTQMLNADLRPVTAKWHRAYVDGRLNSRDGANEFRADLDQLREKLRAFADDLHVMAYGSKWLDEETPPAMPSEAIEQLFEDLRPGIPEQNGLIDSNITEEINKAEKEAMKCRRKLYGISGLNNAVGLGLSGGGIRSATFCLGVVQVFASKRLFRDIDFLSTVSGGGYLGSFLTTVVKDANSEAQIAAPHGPDTEPIRQLRQGAKYLAASNLTERWAMVVETLAGMVLNWTAPLFCIAFAALSALSIAKIRSHWDWHLLFAILGILTTALLVVYAFQLRYRRRNWGRWLGLSAASVLVLFALWILTVIYAFVLAPGFSISLMIAGISAAITASLPVVLRLVPLVNTEPVRQIAFKISLFLAGILLPIGAAAAALGLYYLGDQGVLGWTALTLLTGCFGGIALFALDINMTAPHRLYRNRLARTFISPRTRDHTTAINTINPDGCAPYHIINTAANLPSSESNKLRERRSDFFTFSKDWSGAPSIGYAKTEQWQAGNKPIDLATAMAVSGAAASPHMGLHTVPALSALLTFLNIRLGYWIRSPKSKTGLRAPGFSCLLREMLGFGMTEKADWINLSDGGHIENMGVYELLRRRCKFIISVDGEADPESTFHGHLTLVRHAQIDFGIRIEPELTELRPDTASHFSRSHTMMSRIHYPAIGNEPAGTGLILYLKLSMTGDEVELVKRYRALNPDFPHQTTLDQFFDEEQFEAYRQLGVHVAEGLFHPAILGNKTDPNNVADWFKALAANLLTPETNSFNKHAGR